MILMEISEIENRKTLVKISETKNLFFVNNNKIDKPVARLTKKKRKTQITIVMNEKPPTL